MVKCTDWTPLYHEPQPESRQDFISFGEPVKLSFVSLGSPREESEKPFATSLSAETSLSPSAVRGQAWVSQVGIKEKMCVRKDETPPSTVTQQHGARVDVQ